MPRFLDDKVILFKQEKEMLKHLTARERRMSFLGKDFPQCELCKRGEYCQEKERLMINEYRRSRRNSPKEFEPGDWENSYGKHDMMSGPCRCGAWH